MGHSDNENFLVAFDDDDVEGEPLEYKFGSPGPRGAKHVRERNDLLREQANRRINRLSEFRAQSGSSFLVPDGGFDCFLSGLFKNADASHYRRPSRSRIRCRKVSRSNSLAVPASTWERR